MKAALPKNQGHSADVQMHLSINGHIFSIGQLGPDFIILDTPTDHPPGNGEIYLAIDGRVKRWPVLLPDGLSAAQAETRIASRNGSTVG